MSNGISVDQLIAFQDSEITRAQARLDRACRAAQMKPETMEYLLRNMRAVRASLIELQQARISGQRTLIGDRHG